MGGEDNIIDFLKVKESLDGPGISIKRHSYDGCQHRYREVDPELRLVTCAQCGVQLDPIEVLIQIAGECHEWKVTKLEEELRELRRLKNTVANKLRTELMTPEERQMTFAQLQESHRRDGCPRERMWIERRGKMIRCLCGWGFNVEFYPALAQEVAQAHKAILGRTDLKLIPVK